jgi:hypothetical protein
MVAVEEKKYQNKSRQNLCFIKEFSLTRQKRYNSFLHLPLEKLHKKKKTAVDIDIKHP